MRLCAGMGTTMEKEGCDDELPGRSYPVSYTHLDVYKRQAYIRTRDKADHSLYAAESSPGEYASDRLSSGVDNVAHEAIHQFDKQGRKGIKLSLIHI